MQLMVVDDEARQRQILSEYLTHSGHDVCVARAAEEALGLLERRTAEVVITDVRLQGTDGIELIRRARAQGVDSEFLVLTAFGTIENAVEAMRAGAHDYLTKPVRLEHLDRALATLADRRPRTPGEDHFADLGPAMQRVRDIADRIAPSAATVLITGESGTGKEVVADHIRERSRRADGRYIKVNCAAFPETLLEAELFGWEKGAFTGAEERRTGLFEAADGGTVFLDEIGDMSPALQVRLLRVLQDREVQRLGSHEPVATDFRLLAATHRDLDAMARDGSFREDLLFRLRVIEIDIPPLRERPEDLGPLASRLLARQAKRHNVPCPPLSPQALALLAQHPLPGNVRQVEHFLERALLLSRGDTIEAADLPIHDPGKGAPRTLREVVEALERTWIEEALQKSDFVRAGAARLLGLPVRVLSYKMDKYGIGPSARS